MEKSFEEKLAELESIAQKLTQNNLPLEAALKDFEIGIKLSQECQKTLQSAEQKVRILIKENEKWEEKDYLAKEELSNK